MKAIVVGSGAGGATAARELQSKGFDVTILEAGPPFKPFTWNLSHIELIKRLGLLKTGITKYFFPQAELRQSSPELMLVRGLTTGGCTVLSCGNIVRADHGLKDIGLDLSPEFQELEDEIHPKPFPQDKWRPLTTKMFHTAKDLGLNPHPTPKAVDPKRCISCGLCELGCKTGARWDSRKFMKQAVRSGAKLNTSSPVEKVLIEGGKVSGVQIKSRGVQTLKADVVVLAAGGIGTAQILKNSGLHAEDRLWADIVLTLGGISPDARQLEEPPMLWYTSHDNFILSSYLDIFSHLFHKPWRKIPIENRVGLMVKLADAEEGTVSANGKVEKSLTSYDQERMDLAISQAREIMEGAGVSEPFVQGMYNAGHLGGTVPLKKEDVPNMRPSWLPEGLWIADLSLAPKSQGLPTILLASALALRVARKIQEK